MKAYFVCPQLPILAQAKQVAPTYKLSVLRKHRMKHISQARNAESIRFGDVDNFISDAFATASFDGDADYYALNTVDHEFGEDVFHDEVDEYSYVHARVRDHIDGNISDEEDEMQDAILCELEYQLNN